MISGSPSRYQTGKERYIGGESRYQRSGLDPQASIRAVLKSWSTGSTRLWTEAGPSASHKMLVTHAMMQAVEVSRTFSRVGTKMDALPQLRTWAPVNSQRQGVDVEETHLSPSPSLPFAKSLIGQITPHRLK